eukprot:TRINITY_DN11592_c0_g8_i1.p1 TRINITY_DN11592_c0_g8~~TRINITY_DN11592_c0_g8_i1.p1  ORF type:complete len:232 (+),score=4.51 TRINITY_DN11592_c0_g8_i1:168-863(+)
MKVFKALRVIFTLIGVGMLAGAFFAYQHTASFLETATAKQGVVTDLVLSRSSSSNVYYPVVRFEDDRGQMFEFRSSSGTSPASYDRGEIVTVLYTPGDLDSVRIDGFFSLWGAGLIVGSIGAVFFLMGAGMFIVPAVTGAGAARLRKNGQLVQSRFQGVEKNTGLEMNGQNPCRIVCQWQNPLTSDVHVFRSDNLWFDPSDHIAGDHVPVYINPSNPKRYWVDTSFLPKIA